LIFDGLLTLFVTTALFSAYLALEGHRLRKTWWILSAMCCGLGVLTKGPIAGLLLAPPVVAHAWLTRSRVQPTLRQWLVYGGTAALVTGPWFAAILLRDPSFARHFFWEHHISRFAGAFHARPVWFFVPILLAAALPWSFLAVPLGRFLLSRDARLRSLRPRQLGFLVLWAGWCVLFFSASKCKLPPYILPAAPPLALLAGYFLDRVVLTTAADCAALRGLGLLPRRAAGTICVVGLILTAVAYSLQISDLAGALLMAAFWAACLAGIAVYARKLSVHLTWALCGLFAYVLIGDTTQRLVPGWAERENLVAPRSEFVEILADRDTAVVSYIREWSAAPFYLERNDIRRFTNYQIPALSEFLAARPRTVLITKPKIDPTRLGLVLPPGTTLSRIAESPQAALVLVNVPTAAERMVKLSSN
jgi:dolichol-phosphate mannosyltransferase